MAVLGADRLEPSPIRRPEVPEPAESGIEGLLEKTEVAPDRSGHARPVFALGVEGVGDQGPGHVVGAVAVAQVGFGTEGVLGDAELVSQPAEVPADGWSGRRER